VTSFDIFLPVFSRAGKYNDQPQMNGAGEVISYISFSLAEKAGNEYLESLDPTDALNLSVGVMKLVTDDVEESLYQAEKWEGIK
jgi:hypothetical protein